MEPSRSTLPALAAAIGQEFTGFKGRALPVLRTKPDRQNMPALPLALVALEHLTSTSSGKTNSYPYITETICVEFWLPPDRYPLADGKPSALWAFHDYQPMLDAMIAFAREWVSPWRSRLAVVGFTPDVDEFAVYYTFKLTHEYKWCPPEHAEPYALASVAGGAHPWIPAPGCTCVPAVANCPTCTPNVWSP